ncbi:hypothetical protein FB567DRAFT_554049 [Paraphoma chrysanthemicola]|uniref:Uncharacterized protein n=1 Tax=Paraphoma chrysanthemicola TaxID=798071 RepID=A0A8K0QV63_9PLEO|nr:hypothetical protein FB567DRAFT_554049 [Paraphoma chrysanthemicola]
MPCCAIPCHAILPHRPRPLSVVVCVVRAAAAAVAEGAGTVGSCVAGARDEIRAVRPAPGRAFLKRCIKPNVIARPAHVAAGTGSQHDHRSLRANTCAPYIASLSPPRHHPSPASLRDFLYSCLQSCQHG